MQQACFGKPLRKYCNKPNLTYTYKELEWIIMNIKQ